MPIYEYRCSECGCEKEYLQKVSDPLKTQCPQCGKDTLQKKVTAAGFQLKGSGWYVTDFRDSGKKADAKPSSGKSAATATSTESKPAADTGAASSEVAKPDSRSATASKSDTSAPAASTASGSTSSSSS